MSTKAISRRRVLRGIVGGTAVSLALPFLDCFLNTNGTALAATGGPLPVRFGTWFWGVGMNPQLWVPQTTGPDYALTGLLELRHIEPVRKHINVLSGFDAKLDGIINRPHLTGLFSLRTGTTPPDPASHEFPTLDVLIGDVIGTGTRFRSLELAATGNPKDTFSYRSSKSVNPAEGSPLALYTRLFGSEFQDPNAATFTPNPLVMSRLSVLSAVKDARQDLLRRVGSADRARLDEYFTSVRQIEQQLQLQLRKPPPMEACSIPPRPADAEATYDVEHVIQNHKVLAGLLSIALACNQTKIFNMVFSDNLSRLWQGIKASDINDTQHGLTHLEMVDAKLGYQPRASWFTERAMEAFADFVTTLSNVKEGGGTLLDNILVLAHSDTQLARAHTVSGIPMMTAGTAGGRVRTGVHISGGGDPASRVGLTMFQAMGMPVESWGTNSMQTSKSLSALLA